jgi:protein O-GlcNAc transferase
LTEARKKALAELEAAIRGLKAGQYEEAERHVRLALASAPRNLDALNLLGIVLMRSERVAEAIELFRLAVELAPQGAWNHMNLGYALMGDGQAGEAVKSLGRALELAPESTETQLYLGLALRANENFAEAEHVLRRLVEVAPNNDAARHELSKLLYDTGFTNEAQTVLRQSPRPLSHAKRLRLALTRIPPIARSSAEIADVRSALEAELDAIDAEGPVIKYPYSEVEATTFFLAYHGLPNRVLHEKLARLNLKAQPGLAWTARHCQGPRRTSGKLRIGVISRYLYWHSIGRTTRGIVAMLDRERFEVCAIFIPPVTRDDFSRAIAADAARTLVLPHRLEAARDAIAQLELDVLFYQDIGMDAFTYFLALARLAPVQCVSFGHPDTTGIPNMDWWISSERFELPGAEAHYSERLWRMPDVGTLAYYYHPGRAASLPSRQQLGLPGEARLYTCPQTLFKLHPDFDLLAREILRSDGNGRLVLIAPRHKPWLDALMRRMAESMSDVLDRILVLPALQHEAFLGLLAASDVILDTPHFNGMNSSLESFAVGTPIVTRSGQMQRMRHTGAMYGAMGIDGLNATSDEQYVRLAIEIASDRQQRHAYSALIREREAALFEDMRVIRGYETFFEHVTAA